MLRSGYLEGNERNVLWVIARYSRVCPESAGLPRAASCGWQLCVWSTGCFICCVVIILYHWCDWMFISETCVKCAALRNNPVILNVYWQKLLVPQLSVRTSSHVNL